MPVDLQSTPFGHSGTDPLATTKASRGAALAHPDSRPSTIVRMSSFDVVSEVDRQEVRNAVDQAQREIANRFDFKNTNSSIDQNDLVLTLRTVSEDRLAALRVVLEEKLVKRGVSLKGVDYGDVEEATQNTVRQVVTIKVGISSDKAREINRMIKEKGPKGVSSQTQGETVRVNSKKRDDLQAVMAMLKAANLEIPLQFNNFRD
jgi:cyclic-di-GMP-binding protein